MPRKKSAPVKSLEDEDLLDEMEVHFQTPSFIPKLTPPGTGPSFSTKSKSKGKGGKKKSR